MTVKNKGEFKGGNEILLNYSSIIFGLIITVYLFRNLNVNCFMWSFSESMYALAVESMAFMLITFLINDALRSLNSKYGGQCYKMVRNE